jgi:hypothetical protein
MQPFQPLRHYLNIQLGHARDIAAWPVKAGDEAKAHRVTTRLEDDRNGRGPSLGRKRRRSSGRGNHGDLTMSQISHQRRQLINSVLCPAILNYDVAPIDVAGFTQPFEKGLQRFRSTLRGSGVKKPDHRHCPLLRARRERPRGRRAAEVPLRSGEVTFENMIERSAPCKLPSLESSQSGTSLQRGDRATLRTLNAYRLAGVYAACILNGEKPGELPAQQAMKECGASRREHV